MVLEENGPARPLWHPGIRQPAHARPGACPRPSPSTESTARLSAGVVGHQSSCCLRSIGSRRIGAAERSRGSVTFWREC